VLSTREEITGEVMLQKQVALLFYVRCLVPACWWPVCCGLPRRPLISLDVGFIDIKSVLKDMVINQHIIHAQLLFR